MFYEILVITKIHRIAIKSGGMTNTRDNCWWPTFKYKIHI